MKKLNYILFSLLALLFMTSCEETQDENPVLQTPTEFVLNQPEFAGHHIELAPENQFEFSWSQPNYGCALAVNYIVEVSLEEDFATAVSLTENALNTVKLTVTGEQLATAMFDLRGVEDEDEYNAIPAAPLYVRVKASVSNVAYADIVSNVVTFTSVKGYFTLKNPGFIYLVGQPSGWSIPTDDQAAHYENFKLFEAEDAIGSKIYSGVFNIAEGNAMFRFYTALTGWDKDSYGSQEDDSPIDYEFTDGVFDGTVVKGKGSFNFPDWKGGFMKITVDMSSKEGDFTVKVEDGTPCIYLVGAPEGWKGPEAKNAKHYADWKLYSYENNGIYTGTFNIPADAFTFRFYTALTGWEDDSFGAQEPDETVEISLAGGVYTGAGMKGKGAWTLPGWTGGEVAIEVNLVDGMVTFTQL